MAVASWREMSEFEHFVQFCETDDYLVTSVSKFISAGLVAGDACVVLATQAHRERIEEHLKMEGLAVTVAQARGKYVTLDAATTLAQIMVDGSIDAGRFYKVIGDVLKQATVSSRKVRVFGELVALLWADGKQEATVRLEELWNDLSRKYAFSLFCAYPMDGFTGEAYEADFTAICGQHAWVIPGESYIQLSDAEDRLRAITLLQQKSNSLAAEVAERKRTEEALRAMEARKDEFISMASHELKTPITSLKGFVYLLQNRIQSLSDEQSLRYITSIDKQLNKLTRLINDMLDIL